MTKTLALGVFLASSLSLHAFETKRLRLGVTGHSGLWFQDHIKTSLQPTDSHIDQPSGGESATLRGFSVGVKALYDFDGLMTAGFGVSAERTIFAEYSSQRVKKDSYNLDTYFVNLYAGKEFELINDFYFNALGSFGISVAGNFDNDKVFVDRSQKNESTTAPDLSFASLKYSVIPAIEYRNDQYFSNLGIEVGYKTTNLGRMKDRPYLSSKTLRGIYANVVLTLGGVLL